MIYDIGSGLLRKPKALALDNEPDVASAVADGADIVAFSCDKLLGGPQAGVLAGGRELISRLSRAPLMRALRVGKLTLAALSAACRHYLSDEGLAASNPTFAMLERTEEDLRRMASSLAEALERLGVSTSVVESSGQCGGGTLPDVRLKSFAVEVLPPCGHGARKSVFAEGLFARLLDSERPVLGVLREGRILLDVLTLFEEDVEHVAQAVAKARERGGRT